MTAILAPLALHPGDPVELTVDGHSATGTAETVVGSADRLTVLVRLPGGGLVFGSFDPAGRALAPVSTFDGAVAVAREVVAGRGRRPVSQTAHILAAAVLVGAPKPQPHTQP